MPSGGPQAAGPVFEYIGATALTVFGVVSGARYRFAHAGARVAVHGQDADAMATLPNLRRASPSAT
jgi:hypothetical protein